MNKLNKTIIAIIVASLAVGFFLGYFYKGYEIKRSIEKFAEGIGDIFSESMNGVDVDSIETDVEIDSPSKQTYLVNKKDIEDYIPNINIEVEVNEYESFMSSDNRFNGKARSLKGKIKNNGDRTINDAELLVMFLDEGGAPIYDNDYNPLHNSDKYENIMLKPNYSNEFSFNTDGVPAEWSGKIEYKINNLSFE